jgi:hypothetical protein
MEVTKSKAELIASSYYGENLTFDPLTIMMIAKIIIECISMIYKCYNDPKDLEYQMRNPNLATRVVLARIIAKHCIGKFSQIDQKKLRKLILGTDFTSEELSSLILETEKGK